LSFQNESIGFDAIKRQAEASDGFPTACSWRGRRQEMLRILKKICDWVSKLVNASIVVLFLILIVSCVVQVFCRYLLNDSPRWTEELARYSFIWAHFLGATIFVRTGGHASITLFVNALPPAGQRIMHLFIYLVIFIVSAVLLYGGVHMAELTNNQINAGIKLPMSVVYASTAFFGAITLLYITVMMMEKIAEIAGKVPEAETLSVGKEGEN
jgi:TRAP-type C4-dicarboxylate transport system permease small subunit